ncbi:MAG TPA: DUF1269 domain-containing protein [Aggregatilineaceae bacterium]|nr:DUF1269 domain-containing protein [Aggregatilineaceae bacterium]
MHTHLFVFTFDSPTGADALLQTVKNLHANKFIEVLDAVTVTKDSNGKVEVHPTAEVGRGKGAAFGALAGAIIGLLGGPGGALVGLVSGAIAGGATAAAMDSGLPQAEIKSKVVDKLKPGGSALMLYVDDVWIDQIELAAKGVAANVVRYAVRGLGKMAREKVAEVSKEKIDAAYQSWQAGIDKIRTSVTSPRHQAASGVKSEHDAIRKPIDSANAQLDTLYKNVLNTLRAWQNQIDTYMEELQTEAKTADAGAKADIDRILTSAKSARSAVRAHVKDTLTARLNAVKPEIDNLKAQAVKASGEAKDKLNQRVAKLQADWEAEQKRLKELDNQEGPVWDKLAKSIDEAVSTYDSEIDEAEAEFEKKA